MSALKGHEIGTGTKLGREGRAIRVPLDGRDSKLVGTNVQGIICLVVRSNVSKFVCNTEGVFNLRQRDNGELIFGETFLKRMNTAVPRNLGLSAKFCFLSTIHE